MKNRISALILSLSVLTTAAFLTACGDRSADDSSSTSSEASSASSESTDQSSSESNASSTDSTSSSADSTASTDNSSANVTVVWTSTADAPGDSDLFTAEFKVAANAANGLSEVSIADGIVLSDDSFQNIGAQVVAGGVDVGGSDAAADDIPDETAIIIDTKGANAGDNVSLTFKLANVDVCTSFEFGLVFDSDVLEFVNITPSSAIATCGQLNYSVE